MGWVFKESTEFTGSEEEHSGKEQSISKGVRGGGEHRALASVLPWGPGDTSCLGGEGPRFSGGDRERKRTRLREVRLCL